MEFLVDFELNVPDGTPPAELDERRPAEATAFAELGKAAKLVRLWRRPGAGRNLANIRRSLWT